VIVTKKALPRRAFLRGMGVTLALPLLDAMVPALTAMSATAANPVRRLGFVFFPMGMIPAPWIPAADGKLAALPPSLKALMPVLDQLTVITNLELRNSISESNGNHALSNCGFLSAARAKMTEGSDYYLATTVDQIAAGTIGRDTLFPSLELGTELLSVVGACDNGYACVYQNSLSWSSPTTPLPMEADPRVVFERLFGDGGSPEDRRATLQKSGSLLDWVMGDMSRLQKKLGPEDRTKVSEYLDTVREVERRIQKAEEQVGTPGLPEPARPASIPVEWEDHVKLMFDLQVLALQADLTRVITFQLAREASSRTYPQIGVSDPHHPLSHHRNVPAAVAKLARINAYHVSLIAYFLQKLQSTPDGGGSLLDHSLFLIGSGMGNSDAHTHSNLPILVAGGGGGHKGGRHIRYAEPTPLANLHLTLLDKAGIHLEKFADSNGKVGELFEPLSV
jgi:Protein of unknown function (DUF1552)